MNDTLLMRVDIRYHCMEKVVHMCKNNPQVPGYHFYTNQTFLHHSIPYSNFYLYQKVLLLSPHLLTLQIEELRSVIKELENEISGHQTHRREAAARHRTQVRGGGIICKKVGWEGVYILNVYDVFTVRGGGGVVRRST